MGRWLCEKVAEAPKLSAWRPLEELHRSPCNSFLQVGCARGPTCEHVTLHKGLVPGGQFKPAEAYRGAAFHHASDGCSMAMCEGVQKNTNHWGGPKIGTNSTRPAVSASQSQRSGQLILSGDSKSDGKAHSDLAP